MVPTYILPAKEGWLSRKFQTSLRRSGRSDSYSDAE